MAMAGSAFLAPRVVPQETAPTAPAVAPELAPAAGACVGAAAVRVVGLAVPAAGVLALRGAARRQRAQRRAAAVEAEAEAPPLPPPFKPSEQIGAGPPLGFFDPLGFTQEGDEEGFNKLRASEIKHGRVAMMASIGLVGQHFIKFPGFEKTPAGFAAMTTGEGVFGFTGILVLSAFLELAWREQPSKEPGNFGDPFGVNMYNEEYRNKEINNGRMAMISVLGIFGAELATGKDAIQQFGF
mmetsp:Transcript_123732/g.344390  ORF Transcript_123732/g.344390 Transcript_123732/m.344390 type:complete len:240 (-) Transcript_123732:246-965(-)